MSWQYHPFHIVKPSLYPFLYCAGTLASTFAILDYLVSDLTTFEFLFNDIFDTILSGLCGTLYIYIIYEWVDDCCREGTWHGCHTWYTQVLLRLGWFLFVLTEVGIFLAFFWAYFYYALRPDIALGIEWVPSDITLIDPYNLPILNTAILVGSGLTITNSHKLFYAKKFKIAGRWITVTIILGFYFTMIQAAEYYLVDFLFEDRVFPSIFFISTLMHGCHVAGGTVNLIIARWRITHCGWSDWINWEDYAISVNKLFNLNITASVLYEGLKFPSQFTYYRHLSLELGIWYWHFVDIVWLCLYGVFYCWTFFK